VQTPKADIREKIFIKVMNAKVTGIIISEGDGILAGVTKAQERAKQLGLEILYAAKEGKWVNKGEKLLLIRGNPKQIAEAEDALIGFISKPSGIATAANKAVRNAKGKVKIVSGSWKKMPISIKSAVREAVESGGADTRITSPPFLYLDKNYVRIFGGIRQTLEAVKQFYNLTKAVQLKGETQNISTEAEEAVRGGADILMVDTGRKYDVAKVITYLKDTGLRNKVKVAFAGGIKIDDISELAKMDIDILDIGSEIIDAPLLDLRLDVIDVQRSEEDKERLELNLLDKTELWVENITLNNANLTNIAAIVSEVLNMKKEEVMVVDVRENHIVLDVFRKVVFAQDIAGKEKLLFRRLSQLPGVDLKKNARIHSEGILGIIALPESDAEGTIKRTEQMVEQMKMCIARRVKIFPTGFEVIRGVIQDTNSAMIAEKFSSDGYFVSIGDALDDDQDLIASNLRIAADEGYGLIITTVGVGAEDKDKTIEGILQLDPSAAISYIVKYQKGQGRHYKEGVRIAVGQYCNTLLIALPGPNDEVKLALGVLLDELQKYEDKTSLSQKIAGALKELLRYKNNIIQEKDNGGGSMNVVI